MSAWAETQLKSVALKITKGTTPTTLGFDFTQDGINFIKAESITRDGDIVESTFARIGEKTHEALKRSQISEDDILVTIAGVYLGKIGLVRKQHVPANTNQAVAIVRLDKTKACPEFIKHFLLTPSTTVYLNMLCPQSAQPNLNLTQLGNIKFKLPSLPLQKKIAAVLSAYDDLIENNRRRIALLEKMAEEIYREWFVRMRFPGHEQTKFEKEVPEGWEKKKLPDVAKITYGFPFQGDRFNTAGIGKPIIRIRNIPDGSTEDFTDEIADDKYVVRKGDLLVGMDGEFHMNHWQADDAYLVQRTCRIKATDPLLEGYLAQALRAPIKHYESILLGATVGHLGAKHLNSIDVLLPPDTLCPGLETLNDLLRQKIALSSQSKNLSDTRNALLPRLISGKLNVEKLDIQFPPSMLNGAEAQPSPQPSATAPGVALPPASLPSSPSGIG